MVASIAFLNELVDRMSAATKANRQTRGRVGAVVRLDASAGDELCVAGDLHGNRANLNKILREVNLEKNPRRHLVLQEVVHGGPTYENGGCMSHILLEEMALLKTKFPDRFHFLLCNHELSEATKVAVVKAGKSLNQNFAVGLEFAYGKASVVLAQAYHEFILSCPLAVMLPNRLAICHSVPDRRYLPKFDVRAIGRDYFREDFLEGGFAHAFVWGRSYDDIHIAAVAAALNVDGFVTGHEPTPEGWQAPNSRQLILDASGLNLFLATIPMNLPVPTGKLPEKLKKLS